MDALKCDRCKVYYEVDNNSRRKCTPEITYVCYKENHKTNTVELVDLCPTCRKELIEWMEK